MQIINNIDNSDSNNIQTFFAGIFDGHGGGAISKTLVEKIDISKYFCNIKSPIAQHMSQSKSYNNKMIIPLFSRIQEKLKNFHMKSNMMGSTTLITSIFPKTEKQEKYCLKIINLGDSRAVLCNEYNIAQQLSLDHKPNTLCERQRIFNMGGNLEQSEDDDIRINGMSVSRSFGDLDNKYISQIPDVFDYNIGNDKFIIMGCDGVWDVVINQEAVDLVLEKMEELKINKKQLVNMRGKSENNIAQRLADYAIKKKSLDNISIIIIFLADNI
jgi:serine/threonine protein phosphatase PrpC